MEELYKIQSALKAPKSQFNSFGKYNYRNCEDILEALKPLLLEYKATLFITDSIHQVGEIIYVEATCAFLVGTNSIVSKAQAGIDPNRKGMDIAQCFGASSSYARKYALNGLFLIDDTKDPDSGDNSANDKKPQGQQSTPPQNEPQGKIQQKPLLTDVQFDSLMKMDALQLMPLIPKYEEKFIIKPDWLTQLKAKK